MPIGGLMRVKKTKKNQGRQAGSLRSPLEKWVLEWMHLCKLWPECEYSEEPYLIDFAFPEQKIAIETDGLTFHSTPLQKQKDSEKTLFLQEKGWEVQRWPSDECWNPRILSRYLLGLFDKIYPRANAYPVILIEISGATQKRRFRDNEDDL